MDFTGGAEIYDGLGEKLTGLDIGILGECLTVLLVGDVVVLTNGFCTRLQIEWSRLH